MSNTEKIASKAKHSSRTSALFHETEALLKAADPQQAPQIILQLLQQLNGKIELHVHFVNSVTGDNNVVCNNLSEGSYINNNSSII
jgi:hypothetical protein